MYLLRLVALVAVGGALSAPLEAQGIPRNARQTTANLAPRFMVANPFAFAPADSAPAVAIGSGLREEMKGVVGRDFQIVEQQPRGCIPLRRHDLVQRSPDQLAPAWHEQQRPCRAGPAR